MKLEQINLLEKKFRYDIVDIELKLSANCRQIRQLAEKQKELKETKKALYQTLRLIKENTNDSKTKKTKG